MDLAGMCIHVLVLLVGVTLPMGIGGQDVNDAMRLLSNLTSYYDTRLRPVINQSDTVKIDVELTFISLQEFNDLTGVVTFQAVTRMNWTEERMTWDPADYGNLTTIMFTDSDVWTPKLLMLNAPDHDHLPGGNAGSVRVSHDGQLAFASIDQLQTSCGVDISEYPFDSQKCFISIVPWPYASIAVSLNPVISDGLGSFKPAFVENSAWKVEMTSTKVALIDGFSVLNTVLTCTRRPMYTVLNLVIPMLTLAFLNAWVFLLPPESGERTSYSITVLLSFVLYMGILDDNIPKGSEPLSHLTELLGLTMVYSVSLLFWTIISLRIYNNDADTDVPKILRWIVSCLMLKCFRKIADSQRDTAKVFGDDGRIVEEKGVSSEGKLPVKAWESIPVNDTERVNITWIKVGKVFDRYIFLIHIVWWVLLFLPIYHLSLQDE